eukprot:6196819-Pleurochrysis_carterae.AAC.1
MAHALACKRVDERSPLGRQKSLAETVRVAIKAGDVKLAAGSIGRSGPQPRAGWQLCARPPAVPVESPVP